MHLCNGVHGKQISTQRPSTSTSSDPAAIRPIHLAAAIRPIHLAAAICPIHLAAAIVDEAALLAAQLWDSCCRCLLCSRHSQQPIFIQLASLSHLLLHSAPPPAVTAPPYLRGRSPHCCSHHPLDCLPSHSSCCSCVPAYCKCNSLLLLLLLLLQLVCLHEGLPRPQVRHC